MRTHGTDDVSEAEDEVVWEGVSSDSEQEPLEEVSCDYLVIGAGAMGMSFADEIIHKSDRTVVLVDVRQAPGGRLHNSSSSSVSKEVDGSPRYIPTPSSGRPSTAHAWPFPYSASARTDIVSDASSSCKDDVNGTTRGALGYPGRSIPPTPCGVNSKPLEQFGTGKAVLSQEEMLEYYQVVLQELLNTGRARFFPECTFSGGAIRSRATGQVWSVRPKKVVEANHAEGVGLRQKPLPSTPGVTVVQPDDPAVLSGAPEYLVVGAGSVGMDAVFWLLKNHVDPDLITWILPHDSAFWLREHMAPQRPATPKTGKVMFPEHEELSAKFNCASLSSRDIEELRRVTNIVRLGRVTGAEPSRLLLERGQIPLRAGAMVLDCSEGLEPAPKEVPIWRPGRLVLQPLAACARAKSAALIAAIELQPGSDEEKNLFKPAAPAASAALPPGAERPKTSPPLGAIAGQAQTPRLQLFKAVPPPRPVRSYGEMPLPPKSGPPPPPPPPRLSEGGFLGPDMDVIAWASRCTDVPASFGYPPGQASSGYPN